MTDSSKATARLLPCPFCGGPAAPLDSGLRRHRAWYVECDNCDASAGLAWNKEDAVAYWNERPAFAAMKEALEGLCENYAAVCEGRPSRYQSPNGTCAYDNALAALRLASGEEQ